MSYSSQEDYAYAAGLFDGEGHIDIKGSVRMAIQMTDPEPIQAMYEIFGGHVYQWPERNKSGRDIYEWRAAGWEGVMDACNAMWPYIRGKKRQLQVAMNWYDYKNSYGVNPEAKAVASNQLRSLRDPFAVPITFDIETMGLDKKTLPMLSCSFQNGDDETSVYTVYKKTPASDRDVIVETRDILESAPYTIGWNSLRFDIPWIQERLMKHGERPMFLGSHDDGQDMYMEYENVNEGGRHRRASLKNAADALGVADSNTHKTPIDWDKWNAANAGDMGPDGMEYVIDHGEQDIALTKRVYNAIK